MMQISPLELPNGGDVSDVSIDGWIWPMVGLAFALIIITWLIDRHVSKKYKE